MEKRQLYSSSVYLGTDPEGFFTRNGEVIGAERVIPKEGLLGNYTRVVIDGVQFEMHTPPAGCRQSVAIYLQDGFLAIRRRLRALGDPNISVSFQSHYTVPQEELDSLSEECKILGCSPSLNAYGFQDLGVDVGTFRERSAGGHLHFGADWLRGRPADAVPVLDAVLGNFCVMVDRDPYAAARRKVYGRAGEYRTPAHGLEYRTLSSFWLQSYVLQSMVMGIARFALSIPYTTYRMKASRLSSSKAWDPTAVLFGEYVDAKQVRQAINENDAVLAKQNWAGVKRFFNEQTEFGGDTGLTRGLVPFVDHFLLRIEESGLGYWITGDPWQHWLGLRTGGQDSALPEVPFLGWEAFLLHTVRNDMVLRDQSMRVAS